MHHALEIQEILLNIFQHCYSPGKWRDTTSNLASLARTCRAFREPALDVLWEDLDDLSPLAQCLPDASRQLSRDRSFSRPLTQTEWDILRSYTRRIQSIHVFDDGLDWESVSTFFNPPTTMPLFPNLRNLCCKYTAKSMPLLHLPLPSLLCLNVEFENPHLFQNSLKSFPHVSPNIGILRICVSQLEDTYSTPIAKGICQWRNLQTLIFPSISLDLDALVHLSCTLALTQLEFTPSATLPISNSRLFFSNLRDMTMRSESLHPISRLLSQTQLPVITTFTAFISHSPSRLDLTSFFAGVQISSSGCTMERLTLDQMSYSIRSEAHLLCLEHLRPCMVLGNLRHLDLNIGWNVGLTDCELLAMALAWPHLEDILINRTCGWNTLGGITPNGLLQLLQTCQSLSRIALAIDTRGYTEMPPSVLLASLGLTLLPRYINVVDSIVEAESVPALAAFFACIATCPDFFFRAWDGWNMVSRPGRKLYKDYWNVVYGRAIDAVSSRS